MGDAIVVLDLRQELPHEPIGQIFRHEGRQKSWWSTCLVVSQTLRDSWDAGTAGPGAMTEKTGPQPSSAMAGSLPRPCSVARHLHLNGRPRADAAPLHQRKARHAVPLAVHRSDTVRPSWKPTDGPLVMNKLYYYRNAEYGLKTLREQRLRVSRIMELNDPFELLAPSLKDPTKRRVVQDFKKNRDRTTGILCFSKDWNSPVMWAHYAERHTGVCLGFDVAKSSSSGETLLAPVKHVKHRLSWPRERGVEFVDRMFLTKFNHWSYEHECRMLSKLKDCEERDGHYFKPFSDDLLLREVYIGAKSGIHPLACIIHEGPDSTAKGRDRRRNGSRTSSPASGAGVEQPTGGA